MGHFERVHYVKSYLVHRLIHHTSEKLFSRWSYFPLAPPPPLPFPLSFLEKSWLRQTLACLTFSVGKASFGRKKKLTFVYGSHFLNLWFVRDTFIIFRALFLPLTGVQAHLKEVA